MTGTVSARACTGTRRGRQYRYARRATVAVLARSACAPVGVSGRAALNGSRQDFQIAEGSHDGHGAERRGVDPKRRLRGATGVQAGGVRATDNGFSSDRCRVVRLAGGFQFQEAA